LRPTVAVSRYVTFIAHALHEHPHWCAEFSVPGAPELGWFVQEVRRFYPFFPVIGGRVREPFEWRGYRFPRHRRVLLDLFATNRDPQVWRNPDRFDPERFRDWWDDPDQLIPQGGGDHEFGHRCAGEWITIELMKVATKALCRDVRYDVPPQNLEIRFSRMPAMPASGVVVTNAVVTAAEDHQSARAARRSDQSSGPE
jgi:fatty-acid peroxygenase